MSTQSTQYNSQQAPYDELRKTSIAIIERVNIRSIVLPFIKDAKVLDLACGSGFYSHAFLQWGASRVSLTFYTPTLCVQKRLAATAECNGDGVRYERK